jgi:hypothetical protein
MAGKSGFATLFRGNFLLVFGAYLINCAGDWINYVAALQLLLAIAPEDASATTTAYFMAVRLLPPMLLAPMTGFVADRFDKRRSLAACNFASAAVVLGFLAIRSGNQLWAMYLLAFLQQSLFAQFDPIRRALVPEVVTSQGELKAATTTDAFAWSLMMMAGAASGGAIAAKFGRTVNFVVDSLTYLLSAAIILRLPPTSSSSSSSSSQDIAKAEPIKDRGSGSSSYGSSSSSGSNSSGGGGSNGDKQAASRRRSRRGGADVGDGNGGGGDKCCDTILAGWAYLQGADQGRLLAACFIKATAALTWGMAELLEVQFCTLSGVQVRGGDFTTTLGLVYASSGLGCIVGPMTIGALTGTTEGDFRRALTVAFAVSSVAYLFIALASSLGPVLASSFLRACASSVIWIYSTLLVQLLATPEFFGRVFAAEMALFTAFKAGGLLGGGYLIDDLALPARLVAGISVFVSIVVFFVWVLHFQLHPQLVQAPAPPAGRQMGAERRNVDVGGGRRSSGDGPFGTYQHTGNGSSDALSSAVEKGYDGDIGGCDDDGDGDDMGTRSEYSPFIGRGAASMGGVASATVAAFHGGGGGGSGSAGPFHDDDNGSDDEGYESPLGEDQPLVV